MKLNFMSKAHSKQPKDMTGTCCFKGDLTHYLWGILLFICCNLLGNGVANALDLSASDQKVNHLPKIIKVSELNANLFSFIYEYIKQAAEVFLEGFVSLADFLELADFLVESWYDKERYEILSTFGFHFGVAFITAFTGAFLISYWLKPKIRDLLNCKRVKAPTKHLKITLAIILSTLSPLFFGFVFYSFFRLTNPLGEFHLELVRIVSSGVVTIWLLTNIARLFLKPLTPDHKHIPLSQEVLTVTYIWLRRMAIVALIGFFTLETAYIIHLPRAGERLLLQASGFIIALFAIFMMLNLHAEVRDWIKDQRKLPELTSLRRALFSYLEMSYIPAIVFIVISYVTWVTREYDQFQIVIWKSLITLFLFPILRVGAYWLRKIRITCIQRKIQKVSPEIAKRMIFYGAQIDVLTISILYFLGLIFVLDIWGFGPGYFIFSAWGRFIAEKTLSIFLIIVAAIIIVRLGNQLIIKYLNKEKETFSEKEQQLQARFKTLSSVSRNALLVLVWTPAILLILLELEIDIVPILATVGVLSVGLSFGVQSLVKDFVTGFFLLLEDAFAVGDLVLINGQMGNVESLTIRIVRIRSDDGSIHSFPYGEINTLSNQSRDYSAAILLFSVGIEADIEKVYSILEKVTSDLEKNKDTKDFVKGPIVISGVNQVTDYSVEIRAVLKTTPSRHYKIRRIFYQLLKQYLLDEKIPAAVPKTVNLNYDVEK